MIVVSSRAALVFTQTHTDTHRTTEKGNGINLSIQEKQNKTIEQKRSEKEIQKKKRRIESSRIKRSRLEHQQQQYEIVENQKKKKTKMASRMPWKIL